MDEALTSLRIPWERHRSPFRTASIFRELVRNFSFHQTGPSPEFALSPEEHAKCSSTPPDHLQIKNALLGRISTSTTFRGAISVGLFTGPIPQGRPVRCTKLCLPGLCRLNGIPNGVYHFL